MIFLGDSPGRGMRGSSDPPGGDGEAPGVGMRPGSTSPGSSPPAAVVTLRQARLGEDITALLQAWSRGEAGAEERLFERIYPELRELARRQLRRHGEVVSLDPTELAHEAFLRLVVEKRHEWHCRAQFFAVTAILLRRLLVDAAKHRRRDRRGGGAVHLSLSDPQLPATVAATIAAPSPEVDILDLDRCLTELAGIRATAARIVELRYFAGLSVDETAAVLGLGRATVVRGWRFARAWLAARMEDSR